MKRQPTGGKRLVAYYRYSGGSHQTEQSIKGQRRDCEIYARIHGMVILHEYIDRHISGKTDDRPEFHQMIADAGKGMFDYVICWKTDRIARSRYDSIVYKKKLRDNGVELLYTAEANVEGSGGIIVEGLMEALAEYYSAELAEKVRRGMRESALKGKAIGSSRPLGLTVDKDKKYIIDPAGATRSINPAWCVSSRTRCTGACMSAPSLTCALRAQYRPLLTTIYGRGHRRCLRSGQKHFPGNAPGGCAAGAERACGLYAGMGHFASECAGA